MDRQSVNRIALIEGLSERTIALFAPSWRWMLVIAGCGMLYLSIRQISPASGTLDLKMMLTGVIMTTAALAAFYTATRPSMPERLRAWWQGLPPLLRWRGWRAILTIWLLLASWESFNAQWQDAARGHYPNDAIAYVHEDADLLIRGQNPYTADGAFWEAAARWPRSLATPLLGSENFGSNIHRYPSGRHIGTVLAYQLNNPAARGNDFDPATVHNYPAGVILLAAPFAFLGLRSIIWLNFFMLLLLIGVIVAYTPKGARAPMAIALLANPLVPMFTLFMNFDVVSIVFVLLAWQWLRDRPVLSGLALGFACAVKQVAWFFVPFYLIEVARRQGLRAAAKQGAWLGLAFAVPNLPFILQAPGAWAHSMLIPMADPMFPLGFGPIILMLGKALPVLPAKVWTVLELGSWIALLVYQWRRKATTSDGLLFALVPLWLSWRSPMNYFALVPMLVLWLTARMHDAPQSQAATTRAAAEDELATLDDPFFDLPDFAPPEPELAGVK
ncbi:MAG: DUF2029 domain-containing protein [Ktedonobacterales bacterium]|nr:DUF2029 domain-containing protein [Ktedonobacterales bacterium]